MTEATDDRVIDLAAWLLEQVDADADLARRAQGNPWLGALIGARQAGKATYREFVGTWTPSRALAECDAKRRIVKLHSHTKEIIWRDRSEDFEVCDVCGSGAGNQGCIPWPCDTLRLLALPFQDREGYREEWKP